jgi:hypothetical protein
MVGAALSPPGNISVFTDQGTVTTGAQPLQGLPLVEADGSFPASGPVTETITAGLNNGEFSAAPVAVTLGTSGTDCSTPQACRDAVFFHNGADHIQYSIWGGATVPAETWNTTINVKTVGGTTDTFSINPAAVVSQQSPSAGKLVYLFTARQIDTLCPNAVDDGCGKVYYARVTP